MGTLSVIATPIGNLQDITLRALETLKTVDRILCEDTRRTKKLLMAYDIHTPMESYHQHTQEHRINEIIKRLRDGQHLALLSDSGTPGIADPGNKLIARIVEHAPQVRITTIPGPSSVTALASISGFNTNHFTFLGFLPKKKKRSAVLQQIANSAIPVIFFESPYRVLPALEELANFVDPMRAIVVARELTKMYETVTRGTIHEVRQKLSSQKTRGEYAIIVNGK